MELDETVDVLQRAGDLHTRSRTLTDLYKADLDGGVTPTGYAPGSQSTIGSDGKTQPAAKLVHASQSPGNYSTQTAVRRGPASPIWKPRHHRAATQDATRDTAADRYRLDDTD